jgi:hypothetical protein
MEPANEPEFAAIDEISNSPVEANALFDVIAELTRLAHGRSPDQAHLIELVRDVERPTAVALISMMACLIPPAEVEIGRRDFMKELFPDAAA